LYLHTDIARIVHASIALLVLELHIPDIALPKTPFANTPIMSASNDGSESVDQFLARIASLKEKKDDGEVPRMRRLEEEVLQNRRERQARRLGTFCRNRSDSRY